MKPFITLAEQAAGLERAGNYIAAALQWNNAAIQANRAINCEWAERRGQFCKQHAVRIRQAQQQAALKQQANERTAREAA